MNRADDVRSRWSTPLLWALALGQFLVGLDSTVANVALPEIQRDIGTSATQLQWIVIAYTVAGAALALPIGAAGDRLGRRRVYLVGVITFGVGSILSATAPGTIVLIAARVVQGAGAASMGALALAILTSAVDERDTTRVVGIWTAVASAATGAGPLIGGVLVETLGWRAVFGVNVPAVVVLFVVATRELDAQPPRQGAGVGWVGAGLLTASLVLVTLALGEGAQAGLFGARVLLPFGVGVVLCFATFVQQSRTNAPLLDWSRLRAPPIPVALALATILGMTLAGALFQLTILVQNVLGFSAGTTGVLLAGATVTFIVVAPLSGRLAGKVGIRLVAATGLLVAAGGLVLLSNVGTGTPSRMIVVYLAVLGTGLGSAMPTVNAGAMAAAGRDTSGAVSGALTVAAQVAAVLGVAVVGGIALARIGAVWDTAAGDDPSRAALRSDVLAGDITAVRRSADATAAVDAEIAYLTGFSLVFRVGAAALCTGAVVAMFGLPGRLPRRSRGDT